MSVRERAAACINVPPFVLFVTLLVLYDADGLLEHLPLNVLSLLSATSVSSHVGSFYTKNKPDGPFKNYT